LIDNKRYLARTANNKINVAQFVTPSDLTKNSKKMMRSCAGVDPLAGIATVMFPEKPTGLDAFISS
jgi:hypothetical protein